MPCMDGGPSCDYSAETKELSKMLCRACKLLIKEEIDFSKYGDLHKWWIRHQEKDRKRIEARKLEHHKKKLKKQALEKLSPDEKDALGI